MDLPPPENTVLSSYDEVRLSEKGGAYVAEAVDSAYLKPSSVTAVRKTLTAKKCAATASTSHSRLPKPSLSQPSS
jgi:hypothetical protein